MSIRDNINQLFNRVSKPSNVKSSTNRYNSYKTLFERDDTRVSYEIGCSILRDTQVSVGAEILKFLLSSKQWILTDVDDNPEVYEFVNDMLNGMDTELNTIVKQMTSAILWGFDVHEIIYDVVDGGLVCKDLVPVHIKTLQDDPFVFDDDGELTHIHQEYDGFSEDIPVDKVLLYSYNSLYDEKEGHGLLYDFLPIVEDKENLMDWLMTFAEKNGSPTLYGKTDNPNSRDEMLNAFDEIADGTTGVAIGLEEDIGVLESSHKGETYFNTLQYKDNQIFRRMFIGNLLLGDNSQTGTYAQSQTQLEFGNMVFDGILEEIANIFQEQLINRIVEFNYGTGVKAPIISFDKFSSGDLEKLFSILTPLMQNGIINSENTAIQESLALLFKTEAGVEYTNENEPIIEDFNYQETPTDAEYLTDEILTDLNGI